MCHRKRKQGAVSVAGLLAQQRHVKWLKMSSEEGNTAVYSTHEVKFKALTTMTRMMTMMMKMMPMMMMMMTIMRTKIMMINMTTMMLTITSMKNEVTLLMNRAA